MTVQELFDRTWGAMDTNLTAPLDFISAVNEATEQIFTYLWKHKSELATDLYAMSYFDELEAADDSFLLDAADAPLLAVRTLPSDFRGLCERPFLQGSTVPMEPISEELRIELVNIETGTPTNYELKGNKLYIWPLPADTAIVRGSYFKHPGVVSDYDDDLPFNGVFDLAYRSVVVGILENGLNANFAPLLDLNVGELLDVRDYHSPPRSAGSTF